MGTWVILEYELQGRKLRNCKSQSLKKYCFLNKCVHYLLRCCRAKMGLLSPGEICLMCALVPRGRRGCCSGPLSPRLPGSLGTPQLKRFLVWEMCPAGLPPRVFAHPLFSNGTGSFRGSSAHQKAEQTLSTFGNLLMQREAERRKFC